MVWCRIHSEHHHGRRRKGACTDALDDEREMSEDMKFADALKGRRVKSRIYKEG